MNIPMEQVTGMCKSGIQLYKHGIYFSIKGENILRYIRKQALATLREAGLVLGASIGTQLV